MKKPNDTLTHAEHAEQQLIHAMLIQHNETDDAINAQVNRVLQSIDQEEDDEEDKIVPIATPKRLIKIYSAWGSLAASVLIFSVIMLFPFSSNVAMASIDNIIQSLGNIGDRMYQLKVDNIKLSAGSNDNTPRLQYGKLYLRNTDNFVFIGERDNGSHFIKGRNTNESWQLAGTENVLTVATPGSIKLPLSGKSREYIFLDLASALEQIKHGYDIQLIENMPLPKTAGNYSKIVAEKTDENTKGAKRIIIIFDPNTFALQQLIFDRAHLPGDRARVTVTLDLISSDTLPTNFFQHQYHSQNKVP